MHLDSFVPVGEPRQKFVGGLEGTRRSFKITGRSLPRFEFAIMDTAREAIETGNAIQMGHSCILLFCRGRFGRGRRRDVCGKDGGLGGDLYKRKGLGGLVG
jgi:hypothetical protein